MFGFSKEEIIRYSRQIVLKEVGGKGQKRIRESSVLIVGLGALGSLSSLYLVASGIGKIGLVDNDVVDLSNLQRQIIYSTKDVGKRKVKSAGERLKDLNPNTEIVEFEERINPTNSREIIRQFDYVIDGSDNFPTKFLVNDSCILENKPFSIAGILRFEGQVISVLPKKSTCYRCVFTEIPDANYIPSCSQSGVLGSIPGFAASLQASEALKYALGKPESLLLNKLFIFDILNLDFQIVHLKREEKCPICGEMSKKSLNKFKYGQLNTCKIG